MPSRVLIPAMRRRYLRGDARRTTRHIVSPDIVLVHVRGELSGDERAPGKVFRDRKSILFTRQQGVWRIRALHNTRLDGVD